MPAPSAHGGSAPSAACASIRDDVIGSRQNARRDHSEVVGRTRVATHRAVRGCGERDLVNHRRPQISARNR